MLPFQISFFFFFNDTATTEIYTLSLHDALPICDRGPGGTCGSAPHPADHAGRQADRSGAHTASVHLRNEADERHLGAEQRARPLADDLSAGARHADRRPLRIQVHGAERAAPHTTGIEADDAVLAHQAECRPVAEDDARSEEHTSELQSPCNLVCRLLLEKKKK